MEDGLCRFGLYDTSDKHTLCFVVFGVWMHGCLPKLVIHAVRNQELDFDWLLTLLHNKVSECFVLFHRVGQHLGSLRSRDESTGVTCLVVMGCGGVV